MQFDVMQFHSPITFTTLLSLFKRIAEQDPAWVLRLLANLIGDAMLSLETALFNGDLTWESPFLEIYLNPQQEEWVRQPSRTVSDLERVPLQYDAVISSVYQLLAVHETELATPSLKSHAAELRRFPHDLLALLAHLPDSEQQELTQYLYPAGNQTPDTTEADTTSKNDASEASETLAKSVEPPHLAGDIITAPFRVHPHLAFNEQMRLPHGTLELSVQFYPLLYDKSRALTMYPTLIGIRFEEGIEPQQWSRVQLVTFWKHLRQAIVDLILAIYENDRATIEALTGYPEPRWKYFTTVANAVTHTNRLARPPFYVAFGPAPQSDQARQIVNAAHTIQLPNSWSSVRRWEDIKVVEIENILKNEGEKSPKIKTLYRPDGTFVYDLRAEYERELKTRYSIKGGFIDQDEFKREYLVRAFEVGGGVIEIGLSWHGMAGPFAQDWVETLRQADPMVVQMRFDDTDESVRNHINAKMEEVRIYEQGRRVMEMILGQVGRQARNPIEIPAEAFRVLLWPFLARSNAWPKNWKRDVEGILEALRTVNFKYDAHKISNFKGKGMGSFIGEWQYIPRGKGSHGNGVYVIDVQRGFFGCLEIFIGGFTRLPSGRDAFLLDFQRELTQDEKATWGWDGKGKPVDTFTVVDANRPFVTSALDFTPQQENLLRWLDSEMTLRRDAVHSNGHTHRLPPSHRTAKEFRLYTSSFCPLIPPKKEYAGALGHFTRNPEIGFTLGGVKRGGNQGSKGIMQHMGYSLPSTRLQRRHHTLVQKALLDIKQVVEHHLDGKIVGMMGEQWLTYEQLLALPVEDLLHKVRLYCFVPPDYNQQLLDQWENTVGFAAIHDPERAQADYWGNAVPSTARLVTAAETSSVPLHIRLYDTMKQRGMRQQDVGEIFGVSGVSVSYWLKGVEPDQKGIVRGRPVPEELSPLVWRWIEEEIPPTQEELTNLKSRRPGVKQKKKG
jgi:hypothetical protein